MGTAPISSQQPLCLKRCADAFVVRLPPEWHELLQVGAADVQPGEPVNGGRRQVLVQRAQLLYQYCLFETERLRKLRGEHQL